MQAFSSADGFTVLLDETEFSVSDKTATAVENIWKEAVSSNPSLFDGSKLCVAEFSKERLICRKVPYRFVYAQLRDCKLAQELNLTSACVSGVTFCEDMILWGKRSEKVSQCAGLFELAPSGSLTFCNATHVDYRAQLLEELLEEIGISKDNVDSVEPFLLVEDTEERVIDICCTIQLKNFGPLDVQNSFTAGEYSEMNCESVDVLKERTKQSPSQWVPTSVAVMRAL